MRARALLLLAIALSPAAAIASCASSDEPDAPAPPPDAATSAVDAADASLDSPPIFHDGGDADAAARRCSDGGFCWTDVPSNESLRSVWGDGLGAVWAVSAEGSILFWDGAAWNVRFTDGKPLNVVWGSGPTDVWVGGESGLFHGTGASAATLTWSKVPALAGDPTIPVTSIWGPSADDIWAVGNIESFLDDPYVLKSRVLHYARSDDGGAPAWSLDPLSSRSMLATIKVFGSSAADLWIGADTYVDYPGAAVMFRRQPVDGGRGWVEVPTTTAPDDPASLAHFHTAVTDGAYVWIGGGNGGQAAVEWRGSQGDAGSFVWKASRLPASWIATPYDCWASSKTDLWYATDNLVLHSDGATWTTLNVSLTPSPVATRYLGIWGSGPKDVWVVGDGVAAHYEGPSQ